MRNNPTGSPIIAQDRLDILSFEAAIIFGILPGISMPPEIITPMRIPVI
jgi:hypothetical protein